MTTLHGITSLAPAPLLVALADHPELGLAHLEFEAVAGLEAARRVRSGAALDLVVLGADALESLASDGSVDAATVRPLFDSDVVAGVPDDVEAPSWDTEDDLVHALLSADRIGFSTGPSGTAVRRLAADLGVADRLEDRWVQATEGTPVASLVADGTVGLGFQQRSEMTGRPGVLVLGALPGSARIVSTFAGGVPVASTRRERAVAALDTLAGPEIEPLVRSFGLAPTDER